MSDWKNSGIFKTMKRQWNILITEHSDHQKSLYELIKFSVKALGVAFVAAKSYYFGVGGGTDQFSELVKRDGAFDISKLTMCSEGVKREILVMERKESF
jgi:hypothetical protein